MMLNLHLEVSLTPKVTLPYVTRSKGSVIFLVEIRSYSIEPTTSDRYYFVVINTKHVRCTMSVKNGFKLNTTSGYDRIKFDSNLILS